MPGGSCLDGDEPAAREERSAAAELVGQRVGLEEAFVDLPARTVVEDSFLALDRLDLVVERGVDDDQLARDATRLAEKGLAVVFLEMSVEEARQHALERVVRERKRERVSLEEPRLRNLCLRELEHRWALVEPGDLAAEMLGEKTGSAGHVERPRGREGLECAGESGGLLVPTGPVAACEEPRPEPPVVVLGRSPLVVGLHAVLDYAHA